MNLSEFQTGNTLHLAILSVIAVTALLVGVTGHHLAEKSGQRLLRLFVGWGCFASWVVNTSYWLMPARFALDSSLPLHFCNMANVFGALALLRGIDLFRGVMYFWFGLYIWAFVTPTVGSDPADLGFCIFLLYHGFIILAFACIFGSQRFRPSFRDLLHSSLFTLGYVLLLTVVNAIAGWNYGFLGDDVPSAPTPVDLLGPYPLRILWMILAGATVFTALWLPFRNHSIARTRRK